MKAFIIFSDEEIDQLPIDAKLLPFDIKILDAALAQRPKIEPSKRLSKGRRPSKLAPPECCNLIENDGPINKPQAGEESRQSKN